MKAIGVSCSARIDRNTADLLNLALMALGEKGVETGLIQLAEFRILPCQRCDYQCLYPEKGACPVEDDVPRIWREIRGADAVIYGVPVYSGTAPSLLKILLERSQALDQKERHAGPQVTGLIILGTYGHLNVLSALAPCLMDYSLSKTAGYALAIGWENAVENERTRKGVLDLAENIWKELRTLSK